MAANRKHLSRFHSPLLNVLSKRHPLFAMSSITSRGEMNEWRLLVSRHSVLKDRKWALSGHGRRWAESCQSALEGRTWKADIGPRVLANFRLRRDIRHTVAVVHAGFGNRAPTD